MLLGSISLYRRDSLGDIEHLTWEPHLVSPIQDESLLHLTYELCFGFEEFGVEIGLALFEYTRDDGD